MKKLLIKSIVVTLSLTLAACGSTPNMEARETKHKVEIDDISKYVEKAHMLATAYCGKESLFKMVDNDYYYNFVCKDGSSYMLKKTNYN